MFAELTEILGLAGSDLDHLAKATYYVSDDSTSAALNQIRPEFYRSDHPASRIEGISSWNGRVRGVVSQSI